ncbi:MAG: hypothetical protein ABW036_04230 [Flavitalea sp.]
MPVSLIYLSISEAVRRNRPTSEIIHELQEQSRDDPEQMFRIIVNDLVELIKKNQAKNEKPAG